MSYIRRPFLHQMVFMSGKQYEIKGISKKSWVFLFLSGITTGLSWLCYYRALQDGPASIVVPIDKLSIVITIVFSYILLKEKLSRKAATKGSQIDSYERR